MFHIYVSSQELYHETWRFYQISLRKMRTSTNKNDGFIYFMCFFWDLIEFTHETWWAMAIEQAQKVTSPAKFGAC